MSYYKIQSLLSDMSRKPVISKDDVKLLVLYSYYKDLQKCKEQSSRKLIHIPIKQNHGDWSGAILLVEGSPPKGYIFVDKDGYVDLCEYKGWNAYTLGIFKQRFHEILFRYVNENM